MSHTATSSARSRNLSKAPKWLLAIRPQPTSAKRGRRPVMGGLNLTIAIFGAPLCFHQVECQLQIDATRVHDQPGVTLDEFVVERVVIGGNHDTFEISHGFRSQSDAFQIE